MTERQAYIAFNLTERVGSVTLERMIAKYGSAVAAWEVFPNKVTSYEKAVDWQGEEALAEKYHVRLVTAIDPEYPVRLKDLASYPLVLYVRGSVEALSVPGVAMVGTRRATPYGLDIAQRFAYGLASAGLSVISGLALGIDAASHRGALDALGVTVGVIGSGLDRFYPERNRELAREIVAKGGAVVSEFPFGRSADQTTFPIRNHVVAALARVVLAVEAPLKSGTLITTGIAAELGRTVLAVPARIDSRMSAGCLELIREGATLVRSVDDILEEVNGYRAKTSASVEKSEVDPQTPPYSPEEALIMLHVDTEPISIDTLVAEVGMPVDEVNAIVMGLRLKGFVKFLPGNRISLLTSRI